MTYFQGFKMFSELLTCVRFPSNAWVIKLCQVVTANSPVLFFYLELDFFMVPKF